MLVDAADPQPRPNEVIVNVHAAPVNFVDLLVVSGAYQFLPSLPFTPGKGPAGVVSAVGLKVTSLQVGDRVLAMAEQGGLAEKVAVAAEQCYRLPHGLSFEQAAAWASHLTLHGARCAIVRGSSQARRCWCSELPAQSALPRYNWQKRWVRRCWRALDARIRHPKYKTRRRRWIINLAGSELHDSLRRRFTGLPMTAALMLCWILLGAMCSMRLCEPSRGAAGWSSSGLPPDASPQSRSITFCSRTSKSADYRSATTESADRT